MHQFLTLFDPPADQAVIQGHRRDQGIRAPEGGLLILGEPGSGKTHTVVPRVAYLLTEYLAGPDQCLVITGAPGDVNDRLGRLVPGLVTRISVLTPHDLGLRILGDLYDRAGLKHGFRVAEIAREELLTVSAAPRSACCGILRRPAATSR